MAGPQRGDNLRFVKFLGALVALLMILFTAACGGSGGGSTGSSVNPNGVYTCSYNRGAGSVQIQIHDRNQVNLFVLDGSDYYYGAGTINSQLHFSISCSTNSVPAKTVTVVGDITQLQDHTFQIAVSLTGEFTASGTATFALPSISAAFAGDYTGIVNGTFTGSMTLHIATNGDMHLRLSMSGGRQYDSYGKLDSFYETLTWQIPPGHGLANCQFLLGPNNMKLVSGSWFLTNYDGQGTNAEGRFSGDASHSG